MKKTNLVFAALLGLVAVSGVRAAEQETKEKIQEAFVQAVRSHNPSNASIVQRMIGLKADVNAQNKITAGYACPSLIDATSRRLHNVVEMLLDAGAAANGTDNVRDTALHLVIPTNSKDSSIPIIYSLLRHKADPTVQNDNKLSPLSLSCNWKEPITALLLLHPSVNQDVLRSLYTRKHAKQDAKNHLCITHRSLYQAQEVNRIHSQIALLDVKSIRCLSRDLVNIIVAYLHIAVPELLDEYDTPTPTEADLKNARACITVAENIYCGNKPTKDERKS